jgi:CubicO group peptidase (beta-lactamase class C family)
MIDNKTYPSLSASGWTTPISSILRDDFVLQDDYMTEHATLEDAVCHRTGLMDHTMAMPHIMPDGKPATSRDHVRNMRNLPLSRPPRTEFHYDNWMFTTLSHLVETLTGEWLGDTLRKYLWDPLGMDSTFLSLEDALSSKHHLARGYYWDRKQQEFGEFPLWSGPELSGAGIAISNVVDWTKWIRCLLREEKPLSKAVHADIRRPRTISDPVPAQGMEVTLYGLAWFRTTFHGKVLYHHTGSIDSHGAIVYWLPELDYGLVVFHNYPASLRYVIARRLVEDKLGIPESDRFNISAL